MECVSNTLTFQRLPEGLVCVLPESKRQEEQAPGWSLSTKAIHILRCAGKVEKAFQTKQVNRPSCRDQEGRRGSDEVVLGTSGFPSSETGMSGNFWSLMKGAK